MPADEPEPHALSGMKTKIITDHRLVHLKEEQRWEVQVAILEEMKQVNVAGGTGSEISARQPCDRQTAGKTPLTAMGDLFGDTYCTDSPESEQNISLLLQREMSMYEQESPIPAQQNPLMWWKTLGSGKYPHVAQMAKKYLPSPDPQCALSASFPLPGI